MNRKPALRPGARVRLIDVRDLSGYSWRRKIKKNGIYRVRKVKRSGGILLEGIVLGFQDERFGEGDEQGLMWHRFRVLKSIKRRKGGARRKKS